MIEIIYLPFLIPILFRLFSAFSSWSNWKKKFSCHWPVLPDRFSINWFTARKNHSIGLIFLNNPLLFTVVHWIWSFEIHHCPHYHKILSRLLQNNCSVPFRMGPLEDSWSFRGVQLHSSQDCEWVTKNRVFPDNFPILWHYHTSHFW